MPQMKQAIIYTRHSWRKNPLECDSCEKQEDRCVSYCQNREYKDVFCFTDKSVSGKDIERTQWSNMLTKLRPGMVVIVDRQDRLARDVLVSLTLQKQVEDLGCTIEYADGSLPATTPEGRLFQNILASFAQFDREKIGERTRNGIKRNQANGKHHGRIPYGWFRDSDNGKLRINEEEQVFIRCILLHAGNGHSPGWIADCFNNDALCMAFRNKPWSARTIRRIIERGKKKALISPDGRDKSEVAPQSDCRSQTYRTWDEKILSDLRLAAMAVTKQADSQ